MTPYDILNVTSTTPYDDIKKAYRRLVQKHHPDKGGDEQAFKRIQNAFEWIETHYGEEEVTKEEKTPKKGDDIQYMGGVDVSYSFYMTGFYLPKFDAHFKSCVGTTHLLINKKYRLKIYPKMDDAWGDKKKNPFLSEAEIDDDGDIFFLFTPSATHYCMGYPLTLLHDKSKHTFKKYQCNTWLRVNGAHGFFGQNVWVYFEKPTLNWFQKIIRKLFD